MAEDSEYDQKLRNAIIALGSAPAAGIAEYLGRPARGMEASLRAATGRVDWLEKRDGLWGLTTDGYAQVCREQLAEELDAERLLGAES